jgi:phosphoribosyl-ATP pyrophosphohydrolase/phosphoribosyl-AMP cyclohydrolase
MAEPKDLKWDDGGLVPAVVQDASSGEVLTLAYVNRESLARMQEVGETVFYSRSRRTLWHKGETSGNAQKIVGLLADCDRDAVLVRVIPRGPACHTGARSCFYEPVEGFEPAPSGSIGSILAELEQLIARREVERPEGSYTAKLFDQGRKRIMQKVGEEGVETAIAGVAGSREEFISEASDLLFHLLVALRAVGASTQDLAGELRKRRLSGQPARENTGRMDGEIRRENA